MRVSPKLAATLPTENGPSRCGALRPMPAAWELWRGAARLEFEQPVVHDLFHDKERAGLTHAGQRDQAFPVQAIEIGHVSHAA